MRTTVEIRADQRSALLSLAARRGQKGFSAALEEAIDVYLEGARQREERASIVASLAGSLTDQEADDLGASVRQVRSSWR